MDKEKHKDSYQKNRLKYLLLIEPEKRTKEEVQEIGDMIIALDIDFLRRERFTSKFEPLCSKLLLKVYPEKAIIFEQGDKGEEMYCIVNGTVGIYRSTEEDINKRRQSNAPMQFISELKPFDCVGELSVLYGKPRTATAVAMEESELILLHKSTFDNIMKGYNPGFVGNEVELLKKFGIFRKANEHFLVRIATKSTGKKYGTYHVCVREGDKSNFVYFIKSGRVKIYKKIEFKKYENLEFVGDPKKLLDAEIYEQKDGNTLVKLIEIDELHAGDYFGDYAAIIDEPLEYTAITDCPTEFLLLESKHVMAIDPDILLKIKASTKKYPNHIELRKEFFRLKKWEQYKKNLVQTILTEKAVRREKNTFRSATPVKIKKPTTYFTRNPYSYKSKVDTTMMTSNFPPIYNIYNLKKPNLKAGNSIDNKITPFDYFLE